MRGRDRGAAEVQKHEVQAARVAGGDFGQLRDQEGVAGDVDAEGRGERWGGRRLGGGGEVAEFEEPAVCWGDLLG